MASSLYFMYFRDNHCNSYRREQKDSRPINHTIFNQKIIFDHIKSQGSQQMKSYVSVNRFYEYIERHRTAMNLLLSSKLLNFSN